VRWYIEKAAEEAIKRADEWIAEGKPPFFDLWGCDWVCQEFFNTLLGRCKEKGCLDEVLRVEWWFHVAPFPADAINLYDLSKIWINEDLVV
jgi:hypothetical protein